MLLRTNKNRLKARIFPWRLAVWPCCLSLIIALHASPTWATTVLKLTQSDHPLDAYAINALKVALKQLDEPFELEAYPEQLTADRALDRLRSGAIDVFWQATSKEKEQEYHPIRFPIMKGLLGLRVCIIHRDNQARFNNIVKLADLATVSLGQGRNWTDTSILTANGLEVVKVTKYRSLFHMVDGGRFDGFPRGILEAWVEVMDNKDLDLAVEKSLLLAYKMPFYLYVTKTNALLGDKIKEGLDRALENGDFDRFFYAEEMVKTGLSLSNFRNRNVIYLDNPTLPAETPLDNEAYWFDVENDVLPL